MSAKLTGEEFSRHLNTKFRVRQGAAEPFELELVEVKGRPSGPNEQQGMERFSAFFRGPAHLQLAQQTVPLTHERMGDLDIFLVPIGRDEQGFTYEAVFNYFKEEPKP
ncbi:MAG TPA: hypothetical protein VN228_15120 [Pyrinomonadaceae bacterium]|nr:hypothetical protein [Pyrinomonadaceae bacterium]